MIHCNKDDIIGFITSRQNNIDLTQCDSKYTAEFKDLMHQLNYIVVSISKENSNYCFNRSITTGNTPNQRTVPMIEYLVEFYPLNYMIIMNEEFNNTFEYNLLKDTIYSFNGEIVVELIIYSNEVDVEKIIDRSLQRMIRYQPEGCVVLNYLTEEKYHTKVFKTIHYLSKSRISHSNKYTIVSMSLDLYSKVPIKYRIGHLCRSSAFINEETSPFLNEFRKNIYGENEYFNEIESIMLLSYQIINEVLLKECFNCLDVFENEIFKSSIGNLTIGYDHYANIPMYLLESDYQTNSIKIKVKLFEKFDANTYRQFYNEISKYNKVCDFRNKDENEIKMYETINILILLPLSGINSFIGTRILVSVFVAVDYLNNLENRNNDILYSPIIKDDKSDLEATRNEIKKMKNQYNTRFVFGIYDSFIRKGVVDLLERDELLLIYPNDYEGLECNEHIFYTGIPFGEKVLFLLILFILIECNYYICYSQFKTTILLDLFFYTNE